MHDRRAKNRVGAVVVIKSSRLLLHSGTGKVVCGAGHDGHGVAKTAVLEQ